VSINNVNKGVTTSENINQKWLDEANIQANNNRLKYEKYHKQLISGEKTINQIRIENNLKPIAGGDDYFIPN
jgi:hypothetical protein